MQKWIIMKTYVVLYCGCIVSLVFSFYYFYEWCLNKSKFTCLVILLQWDLWWGRTCGARVSLCIYRSLEKINDMTWERVCEGKVVWHNVSRIVSCRFCWWCKFQHGCVRFTTWIYCIAFDLVDVFLKGSIYTFHMNYIVDIWILGGSHG